MSAATQLAKWKFKKEWLWLIAAAVVGAAVAHFTNDILDWLEGKKS